MDQEKTESLAQSATVPEPVAIGSALKAVIRSTNTPYITPFQRRRIARQLDPSDTPLALAWVRRVWVGDDDVSGRFNTYVLVTRQKLIVVQVWFGYRFLTFERRLVVSVSPFEGDEFEIAMVGPTIRVRGRPWLDKKYTARLRDALATD